MQTSIKTIRVLLYPFITLLFVVSCNSDNDDSGKKRGNIDPKDANAVTKVLVVQNASIEDGNMPEPTSSAQSPELSMDDETVAYSAGSEVKLPISFTDNGSGIDGIYFQVNGANQYFNIPVNASGNGNLLLPIFVPEDVADGKFCITISLYSNGLVSNTYETCITVTPPLSCGVEKVSGGEGRTSTTHNMGDKPGVVKIEYETFTVPDRIDVFYDGVWVAGTGSNPGPLGAVPPLANCSNPTDGYIGADGVFCFNFDPSVSGSLVEVVVSGCVRGGTEWKYKISCSDPNDECLLGQDGDPRFNLKFDGDVDFDLYVKDPQGAVVYYSNPSSPSGGELDLDCECCEEGSENIFWESGVAPKGTYEYWVDFYDACSSSSSGYTLNVTSNGKVVATKTGSLSSVGAESQHYTFVKQ